MEIEPQKVKDGRAHSPRYRTPNGLSLGLRGRVLDERFPTCAYAESSTQHARSPGWDPNFKGMVWVTDGGWWRLIPDYEESTGVRRLSMMMAFYVTTSKV